MKKSLLFLVGAFVLLGLVMLLQKRSATSQRSTIMAFDTTTKGEIAFLKVVRQKDTSNLEIKDGIWVVQPDGFPADTAKVHKALGYLVAMQSKEIVSRNPERLKEYGMDTGEAKHVVLKKKDGNEFARVTVGKTSGADYSSTYWKYQGKNDVFRTPGNFTWEIGTKPDDWKERKLFSFDPKTVKFVGVQWTDSTGAAFGYRFEVVSDSSFKLIEPQPSPMRKQPAMDMIARLGDMTIDEFVAVGDTNLIKAKLDTPVVVITAELRDGKKVELKGGKTLDFFTYSKHPTRSTNIKLSSWRFDPFKKKPFELAQLPKGDSSSVTPVANDEESSSHSKDDGHGH